MKTAVLVLGGLLLAGSGWAQQLRGGFTNHRKGSGQLQTDFYWFGKGRFKYVSDGCGFACGEGRYQVTGDSLVLHYNAWPVFMPPAAPPPPASAPDRLLRVWDGLTQEPLSGAVLLKEGTTLGASTNELGWAHLPAAMQPGDTILVTSLGSRSQRLVLTRADELRQLVLPPDGRVASGKREAFLLPAWRRQFHSAGLVRTRKWLAAYQPLSTQRRP